MDILEILALIFAISVIGGIINQYLNTKNGSQAAAIKHFNNEIDRRFLEVEHRLKSLEQIVTSESYDLKQRFKSIDFE